jgi:hypothetical protein
MESKRIQLPGDFVPLPVRYVAASGPDGDDLARAEALAGDRRASADTRRPGRGSWPAEEEVVSGFSVQVAIPGVPVSARPGEVHRVDQRRIAVASHNDRPGVRGQPEVFCRVGIGLLQQDQVRLELAQQFSPAQRWLFRRVMDVPIRDPHETALWLCTLRKVVYVEYY